MDVVEKILEFNKQNQEGHGLKILTPDKMLSRLPITLAQLKAGNNSEKLKNEIRQLLYFCSNLEWYFWFAWWFYSIAYIQDYFEFIIKKHETLTGNPLVEIYPNKTKNRIVLEIKNGEDVPMEKIKMEKMCQN